LYLLRYGKTVQYQLFLILSAKLTSSTSSSI